MGLIAESEGATGSQQLQSYGNFSETRLLKYISGGGDQRNEKYIEMDPRNETSNA
jgi:hypothetical protein